MIWLQFVRACVALESPPGSAGTGSSLGPGRWWLGAEPICDPMDALIVQAYSKIRAGFGVSWIRPTGRDHAFYYLAVDDESHDVDFFWGATLRLNKCLIVVEAVFSTGVAQLASRRRL